MVDASLFAREQPVGIWSDAIAQIKFPDTAAGQPVYLAPTDEEIIEIASLAGLHVPSEDTATQALANAVATTLHLEFSAPRNERTFSRYSRFAKSGSQLRAEVESPPTLALSTLLARVARLMGATGSFSAIDYYGRLATILGVDKKYSGLLGEDYRRASKDIWMPYTRWLESTNGKRGLSTLRKIGSNQYIGELLSQAVFAEGDARRINAFLEKHDFSSGNIPDDEELFAALNEWALDKSSECPKRVRELWGSSGARQAILELLKHHIQEQKVSTGTSGADSVRIGLRYVAARPGVREAGIGLTVDMPEGGLMDGDELGVLFGRAGHRGTLVADGDSNMKLKSFIPLRDGIRDLLGADFKIVDVDSGGIIATHKRREHFYVFCRSGLSQVFEEKIRPERNAESLLLVEDQILPGLTTVLEDAAQEGWTIAPVAGAAGWSTVANLIIRKRSKHAINIYSGLTPRRTNGLEVFGGLRLESSDSAGWKTWFYRMPPLVSVLSELGQPVSLEVSELNNEGGKSLLYNESTTSELLLDLTKLDLAKGRYLVSVASLDGSAFAQEKVALAARAERDHESRYSYAPSAHSDYNWALSAGQSTDDIPIELIARSSYPTFFPRPIWMTPPTLGSGPAIKPTYANEGIDIAIAEGDLVSIDGERVGIYRGKSLRDRTSYLLIAVPGEKKRDAEIQVYLPESQWDRLTVMPIGVKATWTKKMATVRAPRRRVLGEEGNWSERISVQSLPPVPMNVTVSVSDIDAAVACIGQGEPGDLAGLAELEYPDVASSALARHLLMNRLEAEGSISVARDGGGAVDSWSADGPSLLELTGNMWVGVGIGDSQLLREASIALADHGFAIVRSDASTSLWINHHSAQPTANLEVSGFQLRFIKKWRDATLSALPIISSTLPAVPQLINLSVVDKIDAWNAPTAGAIEWAPISIDAIAVGSALRIHREYAAKYAFVSAPNRVIQLGSDHAKLLSGAHNGWNLAQFGEKFGGIVLPRSVKPIGLYGRLLRLASEEPPQEVSITVHSRQILLMKYAIKESDFAEKVCGLLNG